MCAPTYTHLRIKLKCSILLTVRNRVMDLEVSVSKKVSSIAIMEEYCQDTVISRWFLIGLTADGRSIFLKRCVESPAVFVINQNAHTAAGWHWHLRDPIAHWESWCHIPPADRQWQKYDGEHEGVPDVLSARFTVSLCLFLLQLLYSHDKI